MKEFQNLKRGQKECKYIDEKKEHQETTVVAYNDILTLLMCNEDCVCALCEDSTWVVDSGAVFHATSPNDLFTMYKLE